MNGETALAQTTAGLRCHLLGRPARLDRPSKGMPEAVRRDMFAQNPTARPGDLSGNKRPPEGLPPRALEKVAAAIIGLPHSLDEGEIKGEIRKKS